VHPTILEKDQETCSLGLADILPQIQHFFRPNLVLYYVDFTLSCVVGNAALFFAAQTPDWTLVQAAYLLVAIMALFRASVFIHETYHLNKKLKGFALYYNLLHGFVHKLPFYGYTTHQYHHMPRTYGTMQDPEYEIFGEKSKLYNICIPIVLMAVMPLFVAVRWGILPLFLPFIGEKARQNIYRLASTQGLNLQFQRPSPSPEEKKEWYLQDAGCLLYTAGTLWLLQSGILPWHILVLWFITFYIIAVMNFYRAMLNHRYLSGFEATSHKQQIIDTITLPLTTMIALFYPVSLNYHGLHHMFPQIPYHNMGKAHRFLLQILPQNHPYRYTVVDNFFVGVKELLK
jgi:fatty acid desaturase